MFVHSTTLRLKSNREIGSFTQALENEIVPTLRKQPGFQDEISYVQPNGIEAVTLSTWDKKEDLESYQRDVFPGVQKILSRACDNAPQANTYEMVTSTLRKGVHAS